MPRDASLDEFVGGGESDVGSEGVADEEAEDEESEVEQDGDGGSGEVVSPVEATYIWTPAGEACARCAGDSERLWRCDGELVCGECKEW